MITYQDLQNVGIDDRKRIDFIRSCIATHKNSDAYAMAETADLYDRRQNKTIMEYRKLLYTIQGQAVPDNYSANYKLCSAFFQRFVIQQNQFLLGNGVSWNNDDTADKLGDDFDLRLQELGHYAIVDGVAFGFWNYDHLEVFRLKEFAPLYDEEDGALKAGIRFWQIDPLKPLRATLYELDGYTEYVWRAEGAEVLNPKRKYVLKLRSTPVDGVEIYDGINYPSFPIIPLWANMHRQSELVGIQESIDAYDLIKSGFANDLDDASLIYWTISNAGGMDDVDLVKFVEHMKTVKAAVVDDDGARAEAHTLEVPYSSREALLDRLRSDMYEDFMALDIKSIADGAVTATQIKAAYEPLNSKADLYEYQVIEFLQALLELAGIDDDPSFTRSMIVNTQEGIQTLVQAAVYLSEEYVTTKVLELLGDGDKAEEVLQQMQADEMQSLGVGGEEDDFESDDGEEDDINAQLDELLALLDEDEDEDNGE